MSDYLNNIAARSLNLLPVVEPRLASLFEQSSVSAITTPYQSLLEVETASERPVPRETFPAPGLDSRPRKESGADDRAGLEHGDQLVPQPVPYSTSIASQPLALVVPQLAAIASEAKTGRRPRDDAPVLEPGAHRKRDASPSTDAKQENWPRLEENVRPIRGEKLVPLERLLTHDHSRAESALAQPPRPSMSVRVSERQEPLAIKPSVRVRDEPMLTTEPSPTIRITIGRVDVRAVMPERSAPRPAPERRNSPLSLEEYLKQRSGAKL